MNAMLGTMHSQSSMTKFGYASALNSTPKNLSLKNKLINTENQRAQLLAFTLKRNRSTNLMGGGKQYQS